MKKLSRQKQDLATGFLHQRGRPLERALHAHASDPGAATDVLRCLSAYQNADGGYGRSLEPDACVEVSSVLDTTHALQVHRRLSVPGDHPQVNGAMAYLRATHDPASGVWPIRPVVAADLPCAPWWKKEDRSEVLAGSTLNPCAEVLGYLIEYGEPADVPLIASVSRGVERAVETATQPMEIHDLLCLARLTRTPGLDDAWRRRLVGRIARDVVVQIDPDSATWDGYGLKPWSIAEHPDDALLAALPPGLADAMLDHEIDRQDDDGGWPPFWDWDGLHPEAWPAARRAWKSVLTEQMLRVLRAFGRLGG